MSHLRRSSTRSAARTGRPVWLLSILGAATLVAGCLAYAAITTMATAPRASADLAALAARTGQATTAAGATTATGATAAATATTSPGTAVPPAPAGWATVFKDGFAGPADSAPSTANWFYDIGSGYGTGEIEHTTSSTGNVYLDGRGHLVLKATRAGGSWTSARIESARDDFQAPPGGELELTASVQQPDPSNGLGYWPAFWALGSPMRTGGGWPTSGELDLMEDVNGLNQASQTLHDAAGSDGHPLTACQGKRCESGYHTYSVIVNRANTKAEYLQFQMDGRVTDTITVPVPPARADRYGVFKGKEMVLGLRPEHLFEYHEQGKPGWTRVELPVDVVEPMGMETMVHFFVDGAPVCARVDPATHAAPGELMPLTADLNQMHLMEADTGKVV